MSVTIHLYYTGRNGNARKFAEEMTASGIVEQVRAEAGNESYEYFFPMEDPETVLLIDRWRDQAALDEHHHSEMMPKIAALRDKYKLRLKVERYADECPKERNVIRKAEPQDAGRIAEIEIFNYRLNFYPIFRNDGFYFGEKQVSSAADELRRKGMTDTYVYDDGVVKGFIRMEGTEVKKLFVEPVLQGQGIGAKLLAFAVKEHRADHLWALEKNTKAIAFYARHGFQPTGRKELEEDTDEYLIELKKA